MVAMNPPDGINTANQLVDSALANCMFATCTAIHGGIKASPGSLTFGRGMILDIPVISDWLFIQQRRQQLIDERLIAANRKRFFYDYQPGQEVLKLAYKPDKLQPRATGPYTIEAVYTNGTLTIRKDAHTVERLSIQQVKPYHRQVDYV